MPIIATGKKLRPRAEYDHYPTDPAVAAAGLSILPVGWTPQTVLDPGAGSGVFGRAVRLVYPKAHIAGCDLRDIPNPNPEDYDEWRAGEPFAWWPSDHKVDLIIGNPPYGKEGERFCYKAMSLLNPGGHLIFLFRLTFTGSRRREAGLFHEFPIHTLHVLVPRPSFLGDGSRRTDADEYAYFHWIEGRPPMFTTFHTLVWSIPGQAKKKREMQRKSPVPKALRPKAEQRPMFPLEDSDEQD